MDGPHLQQVKDRKKRLELALKLGDWESATPLAVELRDDQVVWDHMPMLLGLKCRQKMFLLTLHSSPNPNPNPRQAMRVVMQQPNLSPKSRQLVGTFVFFLHALRAYCPLLFTKSQLDSE